MTRKEEIEYLRPVADSATLVNYQAALRIAIEALEETRWFCVTERIPRVGENVLVCDAREDYVGIWSLHEYRGALCWEDSAGYFQNFDEITHWKPLPLVPAETDTDLRLIEKELERDEKL